MKLRIESLLLAIFSLFGTVFLIPPSYAGLDTSFGASNDCNLLGQVKSFNADELGGWIIPNHVISQDPNAGPWKKNLLPVGGTGNVLVDDSTVQDTSPTFFDITETITVGPNDPFTDWHEEIVNPGWIWEYGDISTDPPGILQGELQVTGDETNSLTIFFDPPLPPGTEFIIEKSLVFVGPDGMLDSDVDYPDLPDTRDTSSFSDVEPLMVLQYPTVEDSTAINCDVQTDAADHYLGYDVKETKGTPKFEKRDVELTDQFSSGIYEVKKPERIYNPVDKNGEGISDPITHLVGYKINTEDEEEEITNILVTNQFGDIIVNAKKAKTLLVPSAKDLNLPPPELASILVDHFKCYKVKITKDTPKFEKRQVSIFDPNFDEERILEIKKPKMLCNPVAKNGESILNEENHLLCYDVKLLKGEPKHEKRKSIFTNNQFGPEQLDTKKQKELCVPSIKTLLGILPDPIEPDDDD